MRCKGKWRDVMLTLSTAQFHPSRSKHQPRAHRLFLRILGWADSRIFLMCRKIVTLVSWIGNIYICRLLFIFMEIQLPRVGWIVLCIYVVHCFLSSRVCDSRIFGVYQKMFYVRCEFLREQMLVRYFVIYANQHKLCLILIFIYLKKKVNGIKGVQLAANSWPVMHCCG